MTATDIIRQRLTNQNLVGNKIKSPVELVSWLGAVQAQDYAMAKWALGIRLPGITENKLEQAINKGEIIRTHVLRPTWHFISSKDIRWMMELASPHMKKSYILSHTKLGLDEKTFLKSNKIIDKLLGGGKHLTRDEIMIELNRKGIQTNSLRAIHIMFRAEMDMIVCNGSKRDKQFTYAHFESVVPQNKSISRDEALAELAQRYFSSRSPATLQDFTWWSGLPAADARAGFEMIKSKFIKETVKGIEYWMKKSAATSKENVQPAFLLPAFDEYSVAYKNRDIILDPKISKRAGNGIFFPIILINGKIVGTWKRTFKKGKVLVELNPINPLSKKTSKDLILEVKKYGRFLGMEAEIAK